MISDSEPLDDIISTIISPRVQFKNSNTSINRHDGTQITTKADKKQEKGADIRKGRKSNRWLIEEQVDERYENKIEQFSAFFNEDMSKQITEVKLDFGHIPSQVNVNVQKKIELEVDSSILKHSDREFSFS